MDFKNVVVCSDYDGTLTCPNLDIKKEAKDNKINSVCSENIAAINEFVKKGGRFVVVSGRSPVGMLHLYDTLTLDDIFAGANGTALYSVPQKKFVYRHEMRIKAVDLIREAFRVAPDLAHYHITDYDANVHVWTKEKGDPIEFAMKFDKALKVVIVEYDIVIMDKVESTLKTLFADKCAFSKSWFNLLECNDLGAGKSDAVNWLKKHEPDKKIIAIGDYDNDVGMLNAADYSFCPENATDCVKKVCDCVFRAADKGFLSDLFEHIEKL